MRARSGAEVLSGGIGAVVHKDMRSNLGLVLPFPALLLGGCLNFTDLEEACAKSGKVPGGTFLAAVETDAMLRLNCWRRLAGVTQASADPLVQEAADNEVAYIGQNPNNGNLSGKVAEHEWLIQVPEKPGYTGTNAYERLTDPQFGAGYVFYDVAGTGIWEFVKVIADYGDGVPTGAAAVDELMRDAEFRQAALQPSWVDGAYAEHDLSTQWFIDGGWDTYDPLAPPPVGGKVYYLIALYSAPHIEHADKPVLLPVPDQVNVPLFTRSENQDVYNDQEKRFAEAQISFGITFGVGALDPQHYKPIDQNIYSASVSAASIVGPDGAMETRVVHPGDAPEGIWPAGYWQRTVLAIYTREPFVANTQYTIYADVTHPEGDYAVDYSFRTAKEDPGVVYGVNPTNTGTTLTGTGTTARSRGGWSDVSVAPPGSLPPTP